MSNSNINSQYADPNMTPPLGEASALGLQHVLAMFASNVTPSVIVAGAAGLAFGGAEQIYLIQMAMLFAGIATLFQQSVLDQWVQGYLSCKELALLLWAY